jgi:hypothetical protein
MKRRNAYHFLYLMPPESYEFMHPEGTGKSLPPFYSCWCIGLDASLSEKDALRCSRYI